MHLVLRRRQGRGVGCDLDLGGRVSQAAHLDGDRADGDHGREEERRQRQGDAPFTLGLRFHLESSLPSAAPFHGEPGHVPGPPSSWKNTARFTVKPF